MYEYNATNTNYQCSPCDPQDVNCQNACRTINEIVTVCCMDVDNLYKSGISKINQFFILYLATGLAYSCQVIAIMSDFNGVDQMRTYYTLGIQQDQELQNLNANQNSTMNQNSNSRSNDLELSRNIIENSHHGRIETDRKVRDSNQQFIYQNHNNPISFGIIPLQLVND